MKATHERLRECKRDREVLSNLLYKDREARIEQVFECDDQTAALRKSMRALRERLLPIVDRMPTAVSRAPHAPATHAKAAPARDYDRDGSQLQQLQASLDLPPRPHPHPPQPEVAPRRPNGAANPVLVAPAGVATAVAAAMAATAVAAAASDAAFVHPGQWRVYRRMEYWTVRSGAGRCFCSL
jgi:hypothetical protein